MATLSSSITIPAGGTGRICFLLTWHFQLMENIGGKAPLGGDTVGSNTMQKLL